MSQDNQYGEPDEYSDTEDADEYESQPFEGHTYYRPKKPRRVLPLVLFLMTCCSTTLAGAFSCGIDSALAFSGSLMTILLFHEMGHYIQTRRYGVPASYPYFLPFFPPLGTMGAVIVQHAGYADRKATFDIGISGPLAGLIVAIPFAWIGCQNAEYFAMPEQVSSPVIVFADPPILAWMLELMHGPKPDGMDVTLAGNPLLYAGWIGIFLTALNLIPIGQLDGGHVLYTLLGKRAHYISYGLLVGGIVYCLSTYPQLLPMVILLTLFGPRHPPTVDDSVPLGVPRVILGWVTLCFLFVGIAPEPITILEPEPPAQQQDEQDSSEPAEGEDGERPRKKVPSIPDNFAEHVHQHSAMLDPHSVG